DRDRAGMGGPVPHTIGLSVQALAGCSQADESRQYEPEQSDGLGRVVVFHSCPPGLLINLTDCCSHPLSLRVQRTTSLLQNSLTFAEPSCVKLQRGGSKPGNDWRSLTQVRMVRREE